MVDIVGFSRYISYLKLSFRNCFISKGEFDLPWTGCGKFCHVVRAREPDIHDGRSPQEDVGVPGQSEKEKREKMMLGNCGLSVENVLKRERRGGLL